MKAYAKILALTTVILSIMAIGNVSAVCEYVGTSAGDVYEYQGTIDYQSNLTSGKVIKTFTLTVECTNVVNYSSFCVVYYSETLKMSGVLGYENTVLAMVLDMLNQTDDDQVYSNASIEPDFWKTFFINKDCVLKTKNFDSGDVNITCSWNSLGVLESCKIEFYNYLYSYLDESEINGTISFSLGEDTSWIVWTVVISASAGIVVIVIAAVAKNRKSTY
ncbi:MAG: hypothetical protein ACFFCS_25030 [Candidatus Hodarchaeota archaeon]